jgi:hypothetical protein
VPVDQEQRHRGVEQPVRRVDAEHADDDRPHRAVGAQRAQQPVRHDDADPLRAWDEAQHRDEQDRAGEAVHDEHPAEVVRGEQAAQRRADDGPGVERGARPGDGLPTQGARQTAGNHGAEQRPPHAVGQA